MTKPEQEETITSTWSNPLRVPCDLRLPRIADPCTLVIFGVTGDLARKKLLPAIYDLANRGLLPPGFGLIGFGRREWSDADFKQWAQSYIQEHCRTPFRQSTWEQLSHGFYFVQGTFDDFNAFVRLKQRVLTVDHECGTYGNHAFYMSIPPRAFSLVSHQLAAVELTKHPSDTWQRVIIEKPFGHDLTSAQELDKTVTSVFGAESIFRIDHYLGKETVQNLLALRFTNMLFEPIWNSHYVDHVQITMAEDFGIGSRAGYYDGVGAARDVIQNHLLQLLALTAMEKPASFTSQDLSKEKINILSAVRLPQDLARYTARGQYAAGWQGQEAVCGYLNEDGVSPESTTETYAALRLDIDTPRWNGTPFYLRAGKRLGKRVTEIAMIFKQMPQPLFDSVVEGNVGHNALVFRIQPNEGITLRFGSKVPGSRMDIRDVNMDFNYGQAFTEDSPEAYERLILDVFLGDAPLFPTSQEVDLSWKILDPIEQFWASQGQPEQYRSGTWGPHSADMLMMNDNRAWRMP